MARDLEGLADVVVLCVKTAMAPVLERLALADQEIAHLKSSLAGITDLRDRVLVVETKAATPVVLPGSEEVVPLRVLAERTGEIESRLQAQLKAISETLTARVAAVETKAATPPPAQDAITPTDVELLLRKGLEPVAASIADARERLIAVEARAPIPGPAGKDGIDGRNGTDGPIGITPTDAELLIRKSIEPVSAAVADARERLAALTERAPVPGPAGKDGVNGANGANGVDGLGFEDMNAEFDGDRTLLLTFERGSLKKSFPIVLPFQRYQGVFSEGKSYSAGDGVTWAGSEWHCNEPTTTKPGDGSKAWTLKVKRGRDGKDGVDAPGALPVVKVR